MHHLLHHLGNDVRNIDWHGRGNGVMEGDGGGK